MTDANPPVRYTFVGVALAVLFVMVVGSGTVAAQQSVTGCQTIDSPGEYSLENDVSADTETCIEINSSDVVFDGQDNSVVGVDNDTSTGISVSGDLVTVHENVTVRNVEVRDWGTGVSFSFVNESAISGVEVRDVNGTGINVGESSKNLIADNDLRGNEQGISIASLFLAAEENTLRNNDIENNNGTGVAFFLAATNTTVGDNRIEDNRDSGVVSFLSFGNEVTDNTVSGSVLGVATLLSSNNEVSNNDITNNGAGVAAAVSFNETLENNKINDNREAGVVLLSSFGTDVVDNEVKNNTRDIVNLFFPGAEQEAEDEVDFGQGMMNDVIEDDAANSVETNEVGSPGAETVLSFESNNASVSGVEPSFVPSPPTGANDLGLYFNATGGIDTEGLEESLDDVEEAEGVDEDLTDEDLRAIEQPENAFVDVDVQFDDSAVSDADESNLSIWRYDDETGTWEELASSTVDTQNDVVSANVTEFSTFGVFSVADETEDGSGGDGGCPVDPVVCTYDPNGDIGTGELQQAINDFIQDPNVGTGDLQAVINAFISGS